MKPAKNPWKTLSSKLIYQNRWLSLKEDQVIKPDGKSGTYSVIKVIDASYIVALDNNNRVCLVRNFRYPTQKFTWELPSGGIDSDDPLTAAKRELTEETGFEASKWHHVGSFNSLSGICDDTVHVFIAKNLVQTNQHRKIEEGIDKVKFVTWRKLLELVKSGKINQGQTLAAIFMAKNYLD